VQAEQKRPCTGGSVGTEAKGCSLFDEGLGYLSFGTLATDLRKTEAN
jgi:hypothetical protein